MGLSKKKCVAHLFIQEAFLPPSTHVTVKLSVYQVLSIDMERMTFISCSELLFLSFHAIKKAVLFKTWKAYIHFYHFSCFDTLKF